VFDTLTEALAGCGLVLACTSRERDHYYRVLDVREAAARAVAESAMHPWASCSAASTAASATKTWRRRTRCCASQPAPNTPR
jgi:hypothetical protein